MTVYIKYINKRKNFLFEEEEISFDKLTKNNYIIDKLKELLFKSVPGLVNASKKIVNFCVGLIEFLYNKLIQKNNKLNEGWIDSITSVFNSLYDVINNIFTNEQSEMIILDKTVLDKNSIEINEFLKENIIEKETMLIDINDIESINSFCDLQEIKLFAIKTESNYICMPLDDKDFKGFKAIAMMEYYHSYYDIPDNIYKEINTLVLDFMEFLKNNPDFHENKQYKLQNLIVEFEYQKDIDKINYGGYFSSSNNKIIITFKDYQQFKENLSDKINSLIHEYIHYLDFVRNKNKFTNWDLTELTNKIFKNYGNSEEIDLKDLQEEMGIKDTSAFRYLIGLMQKHKYIDYAKTSDEKNDYTKIKVLIDSKLGSTEDDYTDAQDVNYYNDAAELNTHLNDLINENVINLINDNNIKEKIKELNSGSYISSNLSENFISLPYSFWEKIDKFIQDTPDINKIAQSDIYFLHNLIVKIRKDEIRKDDKKIPKSAKEKVDILKQLKILKKINIFNFFESELTNFFKKIDSENDTNWWSFMLIKDFIRDIFINKKHELQLQKVREFKNNDFSRIVEYLKKNISINSLAASYADKHVNIYKRQLLGKNYEKEDVEKNKEKINKYYTHVKINYVKMLHEKIDIALEKLIKQITDKVKEDDNLDLDLQDYMIKNNENLKELPKKNIKARAQIKPKKELQKDNLLRQYISLLIH